ncbi:MAG: NfeD family protein [Bacilli bacterium]|jgi:membrane protein implicated in regulation of membrane protease activity|nr:NfeD family protein [Bacilli bacterium]
MFWTWLLVVIILLIIEAVTINLTTLWFATGGIVAMFVSMVTDNQDIQIIVFLLTAGLTLLILRPIVVKYLKPTIIKTNLDSVIGKHGIVTEDITKYTIGEVKVGGKRWSAKAATTIKKGQMVEILSIEGVKLNVKEIKEEKN